MFDQDLYDRIYRNAETILEGYPKHAITNNLIAAEVDKSTKLIAKKKNFAYRDKLIKHLKTNFTVESSDPSLVVDKNEHDPWYFKERRLNRIYWESYREYLKRIKKYSIDGVNSIDETTDKIMELIKDPKKEGSWDARGLVVGSVQSGKTSNFIGLINKAADAGYKCFIILSGLHNNLRKQTQIRIDEGFLGQDSELSNLTQKINLALWKIRHDKKKDIIQPFCYTNASAAGDFKTKKAEAHRTIPDNPLVFVIKKNKTILEKVIQLFLGDRNLSHSKCEFEKKPFKIISTSANSYPFIRNKPFPVLVIDDEVDNGSVDTGEQIFDDNGKPREEYDPKTINRLIRQLLHIFEKKSYVGYTATPFANIFINEKGKTKEHGKDLFPKNFIIDLPIPNNHTGLEKMFPENLLEDNEIEDDEIDNNMFCELIGDSSDDPNDLNCNTGWLPPSHDKNHIPRMKNPNIKIPTSLRKAILSFIITCLVRNIRGDMRDHKSMLIHVSRFTNVQNEIKKLIQLEMEDIRQSLISNSDKKYPLLKEMQQIWMNDFYKYKFRFENNHYPDWEEIIEEKELIWCVEEIGKNIKTLNIDTKKGEDLDYDEYFKLKKHGISTIVIGGDKLSRGLTLEGLTISYFLRSAKMPMYDTLMQMGRWFGYRAEYEDLCRIYTTRNIVGWFFHISKATTELRALIRTMSLKNPPETPLDFGLRVQNHQILAITNKYKMRHAKTVKACFHESGHEFTAISKKNNSIEKNETLFAKFFSEIGNPDRNNFKAMNQVFNNSYQWRKIGAENIIHLLKRFSHFPSSSGHESKSMADYIQKLQKYNELKNFTVTLLGNGSGDKTKLFNKFEIKPIKRPIRVNDNEKIRFNVLTTEVIEGDDLTEEEFKNYKVELEKYIKRKQKDIKVSRLLIRQARPAERGALNIYPLIFEKKIIFSISISFPTTKIPLDDASIDYKVNTIYDARSTGI
jgi:hypothetical protein